MWRLTDFCWWPQEDGTKGRGNDKKQLVVLAIEVDRFGIHRSYAKVIPNACHVEMEAFFDVYIDKSASIKQMAGQDIRH